MKTWVMGLLLMFAGTATFAQGNSRLGKISGRVIDADDQSPVMEATVQVLSLPDSTMVTGQSTDLNGRFSINVRPGNYALKISFIGYTSDVRRVSITKSKPNLNIGTVKMHMDAVMLEAATVVAQAPEVTAVADTLVYNSSAYRVPEGSALEELVKNSRGRSGRKWKNHHQWQRNYENHD